MKSKSVYFCSNCNVLSHCYMTDRLWHHHCTACSVWQEFSMSCSHQTQDTVQWWIQSLSTPVANVMFCPTVTWQTDFNITIAQRVVFDRSLAWVVLIRLKTLSNGGFIVCLLLWQLESFVPLLYDVTIGQRVLSDRSLACIIFISLRALSNGEVKVCLLL